ncbi:MAG: hypothetical protein ACOH5I_20970 [Oligoflexus sp.]
MTVYSGFNRCNASKYDLLANLDPDLGILVVKREINLDKLEQVCPMVFEPVTGSLTVSVPDGLDWKEIKLMHFLQLEQQVSLGMI